jgi:hypothetical protein
MLSPSEDTSMMLSSKPVNVWPWSSSTTNLETSPCCEMKVTAMMFWLAGTAGALALSQNEKPDE